MISRPAGQWDDLVVRLASGGAMAGIGLLAVWWGGFPFHLFVAAAAVIMVWELVRMLGATPAALPLACAAGIALLAAGELPEGFALPLILAPGLIGLSALDRRRFTYMIFTAAILVAGYGLMALRDDFGFLWMSWIACVVIATDVFGYFAGRTIGGPKIFPRISPKKTWSGTVAGWIGAALISIPFVTGGGAGWELLGIAVAVSMAGQMGDVAESALKRRAGVKDSSSILPGHGGLMDRFDSMLGASILVLLVARIVDFPPSPGF